MFRCFLFSEWNIYIYSPKLIGYGPLYLVLHQYTYQYCMNGGVTPNIQYSRETCLLSGNNWIFWNSGRAFETRDLNQNSEMVKVHKNTAKLCIKILFLPYSSFQAVNTMLLLTSYEVHTAKYSDRSFQVRTE